MVTQYWACLTVFCIELSDTKEPALQEPAIPGASPPLATQTTARTERSSGSFVVLCPCVENLYPRGDRRLWGPILLLRQNPKETCPPESTAGQLPACCAAPLWLGGSLFLKQVARLQLRCGVGFTFERWLPLRRTPLQPIQALVHALPKGELVPPWQRRRTSIHLHLVSGVGTSC